MKTLLAICFAADAPSASLRQALAQLGFSGPDPRWRWHAPGVLTVALDAGVDGAGLLRLQRLPGCQRVLDRTVVPALPRQCVAVGERRLGAGSFGVIAGPCSVEGESQTVDIAMAVAAAGAVALRGGAFKPRSSPYGFGGLGERALEILAAARERSGLPVVTEVLDQQHLDVTAAHADVLQIGSRNMQNFPLLFAVGCQERRRPVLLKRGLAATLQEFRLAAEYVRLGQLWAGGDEPRLLLCERGLRSFEPSVRYGLDIAAIPILQESTDLPVVVDPSHAAGHRQYVRPLARAAVAAGADGLLVEVHNDPTQAWSDGAQSLAPAEFELLMREVEQIAALRPAPAAVRPELTPDQRALA